MGEDPFGSNMGMNGARGDDERAMAKTDLKEPIARK